MKKLPVTGLTLTTALAVASAPAADEFVNPHRFGMSYRAAYEMTADFGGLGAFAAMTAPGPAAGAAVDRTYDNGFNMIDVSGNAGGMTTFWGYTSPAQIVGGNLVLSSSSSAGGTTAQGREDDPQNGFEMSYGRRLLRLGKATMGFEGAFNWVGVSINDRQALTGTTTVINDSFALGGIIPPAAPFAGTFGGPGPLISSTPARATATGASAITGSRNLESDLYGLRLGPFVEIPVTKRLDLEIGAGFALAYAASSYTLAETVTIAGVGTQVNNGRSSNRDVLFGSYLRGQAALRLNDRLRLFGGAELNNLQNIDQSAAGATATLNLKKSVFLNVGISLDF